MCALASVFLVLSACAAQGSAGANVSQNGPLADAQNGALGPFVFGDIHLSVAAGWTVSYNESVPLNALRIRAPTCPPNARPARPSGRWAEFSLPAYRYVFFVEGSPFGQVRL